jgi:hypothetical protein
MNMSDVLNTRIFKDKKFSDILEEIYDNSVKKEKRIKALIRELSPLITSPEEAVVVVPLIKEYMEVSVKNDEALIKMATIVQRVLNSNKDSIDDVTGLFSKTELEELQKMSEEVAKDK